MFTIDDISEHHTWGPDTTYLWFDVNVGHPWLSGHAGVTLSVFNSDLDEVRNAIVAELNRRVAAQSAPVVVAELMTGVLITNAAGSGPECEYPPCTNEAAASRALVLEPDLVAARVCAEHDAMIARGDLAEDHDFWQWVHASTQSATVG